MLIRALTLLSVLVAGAAAPAVSQSATGRIVGRVLDVATGEPIPGAHVAITALGISGRSDLTGRYTLLHVPAGTHTLTVRGIGYAEKSVTDVAVTEGAAVIELTGAGPGAASGDAAQPVPVTIRVGAGRRDRG